MEVLKKLNRILDKATKGKLVILLIAVIIGGLVETVSVAVIYPLINLLLDSSAVYTNKLINLVYRTLGFESISALLAFFVFMMAAIYVFRGVFLFMLDRTKIRFSARMQAACSKRLLSKIIEFSYLYHTHKNISQIQRIINGDVDEMYHMVSGVLLFLADFFMTVFMMAYLFYEQPVVSSFVLGLAVICVTLYLLVFRKSIINAGIINRKTRIKTSKAVYQLFGGIKEIKVSRREKYFENVYIAARDKLVRTVTKYRTQKVLPKHALEVICFGGAFSVLGFFILGGTDISKIVPQLSLFVMAAFRILPAITRVVGEVTTVMYHRAAVDAVYNSFFEEKDIAAEVPSDATYYEQSSSATADITICNVTFTYPRIDDPVLEGVSFVIPENKSVALVGPSGVGKTTLADLILGVLTPNAGVVLYKGRNVYDNALWSKSVGYIPQHIYLLDDSILANVAFGLEKKEIDEAKVLRALEQAQLKDFVETLPEGVKTVVGDRGVRLSGGQRQRVGIARAIYEDPPVLVLDEATSSLDNETEKAVMEAITGFHGNKTILIIAHRLTTIEHCDIVYRVEDKNVRRER